MAITGINTLDGKQIIAAGASSAISAQQALQTSGGNSLQGLYDFVSTNSGSWTGGGGGGSNFLYLSGTACLTTNGGPIYPSDYSQWRYCPPGGQTWNDTVTTAQLSGAQFVLRELTNGISSFDLTARYKGIALPSPQTAKGNSIPFTISTYPVSYTPIMMSVSPVYTYYANNTFSNMEACLSWGLEGYSVGPYMWVNSSYPITSTPDFGLRDSYTQFEIHTYVRR
jgi:hypothetical protein